MAAILLASILRIGLRWAGGVAAPFADGMIGLLYGISFPLLLLSVRLRARRRAGKTDLHCG